MESTSPDFSATLSRLAARPRGPFPAFSNALADFWAAFWAARAESAAALLMRFSSFSAAFAACLSVKPGTFENCCWYLLMSAMTFRLMSRRVVIVWIPGRTGRYSGR